MDDTKKLNLESVAQLFLLISNLPDRELPKWLNACERGARYIESRIKNDVEIGPRMDDLCAAAAGCAYREYIIRELQSSGGAEIRVGGISVKNTAAARQDAINGAKETRDYYISCCDGLLKNESAVFFAIKEAVTDAG